MPYVPPDTPPPPGGVPQMPAAGSGPAPVPYNGPGWPLDPAMPPLPGVSPGLAPGAGPMDGGPGGSGLAAPNVNPYQPGTPQGIYTGGDADPGGRDNVAGSVAAAVAAAHARIAEMQADTYGQGGRIGDPVRLPRNPLDPGIGSLGETEPAGSYYDPPRNYGDTSS